MLYPQHFLIVLIKSLEVLKLFIEMKYYSYGS